MKRQDPSRSHRGRVEHVPANHLRDRKHEGDTRVGVPVKEIPFAHVRTYPFAQNYLRRNAREIRRGDHDREISRVLAVDDAEGFRTDVPGEVPDCPRMEVAGHRKLGHLERPGHRLGGEPARGAARQHHGISAFPDLCCDFEGLDFEPSPGAGKASLEYRDRNCHGGELIIETMYVIHPGRTIANRGCFYFSFVAGSLNRSGCA